MANQEASVTTPQVHLIQQLGFLQRSAAAFDEGDQAEALRIAVALRVIFHDTRKSKSLLTQLGIKITAKVLTSILPSLSQNEKTGANMMRIPLWLKKTGVRIPPLADGERNEFIPAVEWWDEVVMLRFSRKHIVLAAANQDGGAHVDADPDATTRALVKGVGNLAIGSERKPLDNHHFFLLRQFAYEVLASPDITNKRVEI